jgi:hypothetical protein
MRPNSHRIGNPSETKYSVTNSVEVHPQVSNKGHPMDGELVGAGSLWSTLGLGLFNSFNLSLCETL